MPAITENETLTSTPTPKIERNILRLTEAEKAPIAPPADLYTGKTPSIVHAAIQELQLLQTIDFNAAASDAAQSVAQSAVPSSGAKNKKNKNKKNLNKNEKEKGNGGTNSAVNTQVDIAGGKKTGAGQGGTIESGASPGRTTKRQRRTLLLLEQVQNTAKVQPGAFTRPRPKFYGVQCPRSLGPQGASGCRYGHNCYYGHEGDVYPESTHKTNHYVDRWHSELTAAERLSLKYLMAWTTRPNKWKRRNAFTNEPHIFKVEPRLRAIDIPTHPPQAKLQQGSSVKSQGQRYHQRQDSPQSNGQSPHRQNSPRPGGQSPRRKNSYHSSEQSPRRYQPFASSPCDYPQQYRNLSFQNTGPISPREYFDCPRTGPLCFPEFNSPYKGGSFYPHVFPFQPAGLQMFPAQYISNNVQGQPMHQQERYRRNSGRSYASHNSYNSYQAQPQPTQQYSQAQFSGSYGPYGHHQQVFGTVPHCIQPFQEYIGHAGMNTRNMEQVPRISPEDFLYNWRQEIEREGGPVSPTTSDVRPEPFKFRPEAPEFIPDAAKNWPGLKKGHCPSYPFDAKGIFVPSVANPGFLIWTAAGYGYYGHDGSWYPYRELTDDGKGAQKDSSNSKNSSN